MHEILGLGQILVSIFEPNQSCTGFSQNATQVIFFFKAKMWFSVLRWIAAVKKSILERKSAPHSDWFLTLKSVFKKKIIRALKNLKEKGAFHEVWWQTMINLVT